MVKEEKIQNFINKNFAKETRIEDVREALIKADITEADENQGTLHKQLVRIMIRKGTLAIYKNTIYPNNHPEKDNMIKKWKENRIAKNKLIYDKEKIELKDKEEKQIIEIKLEEEKKEEKEDKIHNTVIKEYSDFLRSQGYEVRNEYRLNGGRKKEKYDIRAIKNNEIHLVEVESKSSNYQVLKNIEKLKEAKEVFFRTQIYINKEPTDEQLDLLIDYGLSFQLIKRKEDD